MSDDSHTFLLQWKNFSTAFMGNMVQYQSSQLYTDVVLVAGGGGGGGQNNGGTDGEPAPKERFFHAHRLVLSAGSGYFSNVLSSPALSSGSGGMPHGRTVLLLNHLHPAELEAVLQFLYQGQVSVGEDQITSFLKTAEKLQIRGLTDNKPAPAPPPTSQPPQPPPPVSSAPAMSALHAKRRRKSDDMSGKHQPAPPSASANHETHPPKKKNKVSRANKTQSQPPLSYPPSLSLLNHPLALPPVPTPPPAASVSLLPIKEESPNSKVTNKDADGAPPLPSADNALEEEADEQQMMLLRPEMSLEVGSAGKTEPADEESEQQNLMVHGYNTQPSEDDLAADGSRLSGGPTSASAAASDGSGSGSQQKPLVVLFSETNRCHFCKLLCPDRPSLRAHLESTHQPPRHALCDNCENFFHICAIQRHKSKCKQSYQSERVN